jgi:hypothetical protein
MHVSLVVILQYKNSSEITKISHERDSHWYAEENINNKNVFFNMYLLSSRAGIKVAHM